MWVWSSFNAGYAIRPQEERPTADQICHCLGNIKQSNPQCTESVSEASYAKLQVICNIESTCSQSHMHRKTDANPKCIAFTYAKLKYHCDALLIIFPVV